jgi:hypothetical protein
MRASLRRDRTSSSLANYKEHEHIDSDTMRSSDGFKGYEKRKIIEKFLNNDEIFTKILQFISPLTMSK